MKFRTGSNELTQKYEKVKVQNDIRTLTNIYKRTNIPDFQLCYRCKCLARYACSPIIYIYVMYSWKNSQKS